MKINGTPHARVARWWEELPPGVLVHSDLQVETWILLLYKQADAARQYL